MSNHENDDESLAKTWLYSQGYSSVERAKKDPPDYVVDSDFAVEVRRLNQRIEIDGRIKGEENSRIPLRQTIKGTLAKIGPSGGERDWVVNCEYDFTRALPSKKVVESQIREAISLLTWPYNTNTINQLNAKYLNYDKHADELDLLNHPHLCLRCGICLELHETSMPSPGFSLWNVSGREGIGVAHELINSIQHYVTEKSTKIRKGNRITAYKEWWLLLVDHVCHMPISILEESELQALLESIQDRDFWSRIVIISSNNIDWSYEL
ncbi:MAG: hypothetical protein OXH92_09520 [Bryobacterales bacterium]|nr:hypothetical protein [Bryobacterales bacterium]MDE0295976.1 hypothetical protein [Bryobacterales bacterium]MDE0434233.1 hypothetical protein [Bryobacterales bacterium]